MLNVAGRFKPLESMQLVKGQVKTLENPTHSFTKKLKHKNINDCKQYKTNNEQVKILYIIIKTYRAAAKKRKLDFPPKDLVTSLLSCVPIRVGFFF